MAELKLQNISKCYKNGFNAVKGVSLDIKDKEFVVLVGPSGCGKSTTLRMIAGIEEITSGDIYIEDKVVNDIDPKNRDIAMVFQNYALYPHMNVYDNMAFALKLKGTSKDDIDLRVKEAAKILGLENILNRKPKELSGGQRQRVALGRSIVRKPKVFLMDEPLSNLDAKLRVTMRSEISKLHKKLNTTFIYVTHDQIEAMTMGTKIVVMRNGVIEQVGDPITIYKKPYNVFVASFIGSPQMNFVDVKVVEDGDEIIGIINETKFNLPKDKVQILKTGNYLNKTIKLGIRPEHIYEANSLNNNEDYIEINGTVELTELLGAETYLYLIVEGHSFIARVSSEVEFRVGDKIKVFISKNHIHGFDLESEKAIF